MCFVTTTHSHTHTVAIVSYLSFCAHCAFTTTKMWIKFIYLFLLFSFSLLQRHTVPFVIFVGIEREIGVGSARQNNGNMPKQRSQRYRLSQLYYGFAKLRQSIVRLWHIRIQSVLFVASGMCIYRRPILPPAAAVIVVKQVLILIAPRYSRSLSLSLLFSLSLCLFQMRRWII